MNKKILILKVLILYTVLCNLFNTLFAQLAQIQQFSPYIITFFIKPLPKEKEKEVDIKKLENNIKTPEKVVKALMSKTLDKYIYTGIYCCYAGFATYSDINGQVNFIRKTVEPKLYLLITQDIKPVLVDPVNKNTILGFSVDPKTNSQYYLLERKENPETQLYTWFISEQQIPTNKILPYDTIIIFANPKNFIMPTVNISTIAGENLLLPDIYIIKNSDNILNTLRFFKIRQYFSSVKTKYEFKEDSYQQRVIN